MKSAEIKGNILALCSILLWCFSGICMRKGAEVLQPLTYLGLITGIGVLTAICIQFLQKKSIQLLFQLPLKVIVAGFFGVTVYTFFLFMAFAMVDRDEIGLINLLNYFWPVWLVLLEIVFFRKKPRIMLLFLGLMLSLFGLVLAARPSSISLDTGNFIPHLMALSGGLFWAFYSILIRKWNIPREQSGTAFHFTVCTAASFLFAAISGEFFSLPDLTGESIFWVVAGGVGPVGIAYYLWELGIKEGSVSLIASASYFIPIMSTLLIAVIFNESMHWGLIPGAICIGAGAYFVQKAMICRTKTYLKEEKQNEKS